MLLLTILSQVLSGCAAQVFAEPVDVDATATPDRDMEEISAAAAEMVAGASKNAGRTLEGRSYAGPLTHPGGSDCRTCHAPDADATGPDSPDWRPMAATCEPCHAGQTTTLGIRGASRPDHDGDGDTTEPLSDELDDMLADLMASIRAASMATGTSICFHPRRYPHWMNDSDGDGVCGPEEAHASNAYEIWTEPLLHASYNYQTVTNDRGAWAHNFDYAAQLIIDSMELLGDDVSGYARPK